MHKPELVLDKLRKIKELAYKGATFGERQAAMAALEAMLKKHGLTMDDLLTGDRKMRVFVVKMADRDLFECCFYTVLGWDDKRPRYRPASGKGRGTHIQAELSAREYADICTLFDFYRTALKREETLFFRAFITKHSLGRPADPDESGTTENPDDTHAAYQLMRAMRSYQNPLTTAQISHKA